MVDKTLPFTGQQLETLLRDFPSPVYLYDEKGIRDSARRLHSAFSWTPAGFQNYFAVKATPNPHILEILRQEGQGADCSSMAELILAQISAISGENVFFTSNNTPAEEFQKAMKIGAIINLDDLTHIEFLERTAGIPDVVCFRYNPGPIKAGNSIIGKPEEAKYGLTRDQIFEAYRIMKQKGTKRFGLHTMVASNELNPKYFIDTAKMVFDLAVEISRRGGITFEFLNLGGGIGIPYKPEQDPVDLNEASSGIKQAYQETIAANGLGDVKLAMECGRLITGPHGYLVTKVLHVSEKHRSYVGVDASMANLMRPGMYGAYHHITVLGKEDSPHDRIYDVTGSLCENNDKFAIQRKLPKLEQGDIMVIHDAGAHGHSMGFQYNGKLRSAEVLLLSNGTFQKIRRAETFDDYFRTLEHPGLVLPK